VAYFFGPPCTTSCPAEIVETRNAFGAVYGCCMGPNRPTAFSWKLSTVSRCLGRRLRGKHPVQDNAFCGSLTTELGKTYTCWPSFETTYTH